MRAPLPPPARPPMRAPRHAAPAVKAAERLPRPLRYFSYSLVSTRWPGDGYDFNAEVASTF